MTGFTDCAVGDVRMFLRIDVERGLMAVGAFLFPLRIQRGFHRVEFAWRRLIRVSMLLDGATKGAFDYG